MKAKIEMLDDNGNVTELIEDVHVCVGGDAGEPARCETCGHVATPEKPVYVWTSGTGLDYFGCGACISGEAYARLFLL